MGFLTWYGIGVATLFVTFAQQAARESGVVNGAREMYDVFIRRGDVVSTSLLLLLALAGPLLIVGIAYLVGRNWYDSLPVNDDDTKVYPWS